MKHAVEVGSVAMIYIRVFPDVCEKVLTVLFVRLSVGF
jgi:hypothetical protein